MMGDEPKRFRREQAEARPSYEYLDARCDALAARVKELEVERDEWKHAADDRRDNVRLLKQSNNAMFVEFKARVKELEEALEWYAGDGSIYDGIDVGQRARAALKDKPDA